MSCIHGFPPTQNLPPHFHGKCYSGSSSCTINHPLADFLVLCSICPPKRVEIPHEALMQLLQGRFPLHSEVFFLHTTSSAKRALALYLIMQWFVSFDQIGTIQLAVNVTVDDSLTRMGEGDGPEDD